MINDEFNRLQVEKRGLSRTIYADFDPKLKKQSIYKSIRLMGVQQGTAYYETEPYDDAYRTDAAHFEETFQKIARAFKKYQQQIFEKYSVDNISVEIYDEMSCVAGLSVLPDGTIITSNF